MLMTTSGRDTALISSGVSSKLAVVEEHEFLSNMDVEFLQQRFANLISIRSASIVAATRASDVAALGHVAVS